MKAQKNNPVELIASKDSYYVRISFFKEKWFLGVMSLVLVGFALFLLPPSGRRSSFVDWFAIGLFFSLAFGLVVFTLTDHRKPVWLKRLASLGLLFIFLWLFYQYSGTQWDRIQDKFLNFKSLEGLGPAYLEGLIISLKLTVMAIGFSVLLGLILGVLRSFHNPVIELFLAAYVDVFRSIPLIALMMLIFYALPFLGVNLEPFTAATVAIVIMYSAYIAEIFRAGIEAIARIQVEAAASLGLSSLQTLRLVIFPQALRIIIPPLTSSLVGVLKDTAVAYVVTLPELLTQAQQAMLSKGNPTPLIAVSGIYLIILLPLTRLASQLENRSKRWVKKTK